MANATAKPIKMAIIKNAVKGVIRNMSAEEVKKYELYKTPNSSIRVNGTSGKDNVNLVPFGKGDLFKEFAEKYDTTFPEFAAAMEIFPKVDLDFGVDNPFDKLDEYEFLEFNKDVYKYSGGTNEDALNITVITDLN